MTLVMRFLVLGLLVLASNQTRADVILAKHQGANDPETEGWSRYRPFINVATFPVIDDLSLGVDSWAVDDNGAGQPFIPPQNEEDGVYGFGLTNQEAQLAETNGWHLMANVRVVDEVTPSDSSDSATRINFRTSTGRLFALKFGREADGSPLLSLKGEATLLDFDDLDSGYHLYELITEPGGQEADLYVDGVLRLADYGGFASVPPLPGQNLIFGSTLNTDTGHANYNLVQLNAITSPESVPEPSTFITWSILAFIGTVFYNRRRFACQCT